MPRHSVKEQSAFTNTVPRNDGHVCHAELVSASGYYNKIPDSYCLDCSRITGLCPARLACQQADTGIALNSQSLRQNDVMCKNQLFAKHNVNHLLTYLPTNLLTSKKRKAKVAFTLAEVLITLTIIGVVAALTLPTLIQNHRKKEVVTKLEKVYSVMNNAIRLSEVDNGSMTEWDIDCGPSYAPTCTLDDVEEKYNIYFKKYIKTLKVEKNNDKNKLLIYFPDGSILLIPPHFYDMDYYINTKALNNEQLGSNFFLFKFVPKILPSIIGREESYKYHLGKGFEPFAYEWYGTRNELRNKNHYGCASTGKNFCAKFIQYEGWTIPEDYPVKF